MLALWLCGACVLLIACNYLFARPVNFPPGPPRLPVWGSYWFIFLANYRYTYKALAVLGRLYRTTVLGLHVGPFPAVVLLDIASIKEMFDNPHCQARVQNTLTSERAMGKTRGLIFDDGEVWKNQRRFTLRNMRDLGYARRSSSFEDVEAQEVQDLLSLVRGGRKDEMVFKDGYLRLPLALSVGGANALCHAIFSDRFLPAEHHQLYALAEKACLTMREVDAMGSVIAITPWLRHFTRRQFGLRDFLRGTSATTNFFKVFLDEHKSTYDNNSLRDFFDIYLHKMKQNIETTGSGGFFTDEELLMIVTDMMLPAIATMAAFTSYILLQLMHHPDKMKRAQEALDTAIGRDRLPTLDDRHRYVVIDEELLMIVTDMMLPAIATMAAFTSYILLQLMHHPDKMKRAQEALDTAIGRDRLPTLDDRHSLPYIEAIIREALRIHTTAPMAVMRRATADTSIAGYPIAKETIIIPDLWAAHRDPSMWQDPDEFRPERFLDDDGNILKRDYSLPFGGGKRVCVGETFARHHIFLFLAALLQNCEFAGPPPGSTLPCPERDVIPGLTITPPDFQLRVTFRE